MEVVPDRPRNRVEVCVTDTVGTVTTMVMVMVRGEAEVIADVEDGVEADIDSTNTMKMTTESCMEKILLIRLDFLLAVAVVLLGEEAALLAKKVVRLVVLVAVAEADPSVVTTRVAIMVTFAGITLMG